MIGVDPRRTRLRLAAPAPRRLGTEARATASSTGRWSPRRSSVLGVAGAPDRGVDRVSEWGSALSRGPSDRRQIRWCWGLGADL